MKVVKLNKYVAGKKYQERTAQNGDTGFVAAKKLNQIYHAIVGSAAQVTDRIATHTSLQLAIDTASTGDTILVLAGTYLTSDITLNKRLSIIGQGYDSYINANITFSSCSFASINSIRFNRILLGGGSNGNIINAFWSVDPLDNGIGNNITGVNIT